MSSSEVLGAVVLVRHGDRQGFYQDPTTYTASATAITALGALEEFALGQLLRSLYLNASSPSYITGISTGVLEQNQVALAADAGGEGGVIFDSAVALAQGLWPPTSAANSSLANGTVIGGPLNGYQYVPIAAVDPDEDVSLEGWEDCGAFTNATAAFYASPAFAAKQAETKAFLGALPPYLDGRNVSLQNMWNIYDYMNVNNIHNSTFAASIPMSYMKQARALANWHEYNVFSDAQLAGIGNIAGRTLLPSLLSGLQDIASGATPTKLVINALAYKPFLSLFNMTGVAQQYPELAGIVDYASAAVLEVRTGPVVRLAFRNGTQPFATYGLLGRDAGTDVPLAELVAALQPAALNGTAAWCAACGNTADRGCAAYYSTALRPPQVVSGHRGLSAAGAGAVGAAVTLAVCALGLATLVLLGLLTFGRKSARRSWAPRRSASYATDEPEELDMKVRA